MTFYFYVDIFFIAGQSEGFGLPQHIGFVGSLDFLISFENTISYSVIHGTNVPEVLFVVAPTMLDKKTRGLKVPGETKFPADLWKYREGESC